MNVPTIVVNSRRHHAFIMSGKMCPIRIMSYQRTDRTAAGHVQYIEYAAAISGSRRDRSSGRPE